MPTTDAPCFSILIPVRNDAANLRACLAALAKQDLANCEVLIGDDGSGPAVSESDVKSSLATARVFRCEGRGPAAARNLLAWKAAGDYLFFLDADVQAGPGLLQQVRSAVRDDPHLAGFFGSYDDAPLHRTLISQYRNLLHHYVHQRAAGPIASFWCGCGVIRKDLFLAEGGLSESFAHPSIEDVELGIRLSRKGTEIRCLPRLQVKHRKRWTLRTWLYTDLFLRGIPWVRLMRRQRDWPSQLNFTLKEKASVTLGCAVPASLFLALFWQPAVWLTGISLGLFLILNAGFWALLFRRAGGFTAIAAVPFHIVYSVVCALAFIVGILPGGSTKPTLEHRRERAS